MSEQKKFKVAIVGCGMIYNEHIPALREIGDKVEIVAAVDHDPAALKKAQAKFGLAEEILFSDWKTMLAEVKPDGVDICLPNHEHFPCAMDAIAAGCHVYCEKPLALNVAEAEQMVAAANAANVKLAVGFQQEYNPGTELLINARNEGFFGDLRFIHGSLIRRRGVPGYGIYCYREPGGGPIMDIAVHLLDIMTYVCDRPQPKRITASFFYGEGNDPANGKVFTGSGEWDYENYNVEDLAAVQITFDTGLVIQMETSYINQCKDDLVYDFKLTGSKGGAWWQVYKAPEFYTDKFGAMMNMTPVYLPSQGRPDMFRKKLENWVNACTTGTELLLPGEVGLYVQRMLDGIMLAAKTGKEVLL